MGNKAGKIHIGTSGWHYAHWKGPFYPSRMSDQKLLAYYFDRFRTVEINRTFYSLPARKVFTAYAKKAPRGFIFAVKASRFITHIKRLKDPKAHLRYLFSRIGGLKSRLGPILFQIPPGFKVNRERFEAFLKSLPKGHRYTFEFRDPSWLNEEIFALLKKHKAAFCIYELDRYLTPKLATANFVYVRLHGPDGAYSGNYSTKTLKSWARFFLKEAKKGRDVYCYFDNDEAGYAPRNALQLITLLKSVN